MLDFANPMRVTIVGYSDDAMEPFISRDGRYLFFNNSNDPLGRHQPALRRAHRRSHLSISRPLGGVNTSALEAVASEADDGTFYFISNRSYATTMATIYRGSFAAGTSAMSSSCPALQPAARGT